MNKSVSFFLALPLLSSCITLPSLTADQSRYAAYVAEAICVASIVGNTPGLSQEKVDALKSKYGSTDLNKAFEQANADISSAAKVEEVTSSLQDDPVAAGLFAKEVVTNIQNSCGLQNAANVAQQLQKYVPNLQ